MNFYPEPQTFDLRDEFHDSLFGTLIEPGIGQAVLLRRLRDQVCVCWDGITGSADAACRARLRQGHPLSASLLTHLSRAKLVSSDQPGRALEHADR